MGVKKLLDAKKLELLKKNIREEGVLNDIEKN